MKLRTLIARSFWFHRRGNLAVLLGVAVGAAVITGALLVGDSLRGSLRDRALRGLAWVDVAMVSPRFVRIPANHRLGEWAERGITLRANLQGRDGKQISPATVWATQKDFARRTVETQPRVDLLTRLVMLFTGGPGRVHLIFEQPFPRRIEAGQVWMAERTAATLGVRIGDAVQLQVARRSEVPRESLLGRKSGSDSLLTLPAVFGGILANDDPMADFSIVPGTTEPQNVFVNLAWLQDAIGEPGKANALLLSRVEAKDAASELAKILTLDDWGLVVRTPSNRTDALIAALDRNKDGSIQPGEWRGRLAEVVVEHADANRNRTLSRGELTAEFENRGYVSLESHQMLLEPAVERAALASAKDVGLRAAPTLIYLANSISDGRQSIPYSIVAALDPAALPSAPQLLDDEILLAEWTASPLAAKPGDTIEVTFFEPELEGRIQERTARFRLRGFVPMTGLAADPDLAPEFPGITDKLDLKDWDPPFPYDNKRIQRRDDEYWGRYRTTPKAYITTAAGQRLFGSRFGQATSIRLSGQDGKLPNEQAVQQFEKALLSHLDPAAGGFVFEDVRRRALEASRGGQDFGLLFLGFSFFLIAAALLLVGLLVRLNGERRAREIGLLLATGFSTAQVRRLLVREAMAVAVIGAILGVALAVGYAALMLKLLTALWPDGSVGSLLRLHVTPLSMAIGFVATLLVAWLAIRWALRSLSRVPPSALLGGATTVQVESLTRSPRRAKMVAIGAAIGAIVLLVGGRFVHGIEERAGAFFGGGALALTALLATGWVWLRRPERRPLEPGPTALARLGSRNTARNPGRSLLTAALLASAAFLLVAVESFRRNPEADFSSRTGGSGGFALMASTTVPLYQDPGSPEGRQELLDALESRWRRETGSTPESIRQRLDGARTLLESATIIPLRRQQGDDASCLNLYQPGRPRVMAAPSTMIERGGFRFAASEGPSDNPWRLLETPREDGEIPAIVEAHTAQWMLKSGLGGTISIPDDQGREVRLRIVALLQDSPFQGELFVSSADFRRLFPRQEGFTELLIDPAGQADAVRDLLAAAYADRGIGIESTRDKVQSYLQVENTYLSTFQILGGFGLLLGTAGLAVVLLRNVWERRREFALMSATGYQPRDLAMLVMVENAVLVGFGIAAGVTAALLAVLPSGSDANTPWARLGLLLALVFVAGLAAGAAAVRTVVRAPVIPALRDE